MNNDVDFELIKYYIDELTKMFEKKYQNSNERGILLKHKLWLTQYSKVIEFLESHPEMQVSDIKNNYIPGSFNPANWISCQKAAETRGNLLLYRQHFLMMINFPLKIDRENYQIIDPRKPVVFEKNDINNPGFKNLNKAFIKAKSNFL